MQRVTINYWPASQKCASCPFTLGLVQEVPGQRRSTAANSYICSRGEDAETCEIPEAFSAARVIVGGLTPSSISGALRRRRKIAAKPNCPKCNGEGEVMNLTSQLAEACECTK
jgi:hypothetical protein